ncbi:reverse transcriptase family protein [Actinoplanes auranticolor]|uniref:reverse transcriptase family protein n=1 Tax=Actinoplanes auranticolor TaxID=47988 RepID=UPI001BB44B10|nr:reverse transcriptase family protein [Actinoplanes auranticolor]
MTTAAHRRRASALRAARRRHDRASSGHAATTVGRDATALADALLTTSWRRAALLRAAWVVFGRRARWVRPAVDAVLRAYREAPGDRPRELAGFLAASGRLGAHRTVVRHRLVAPTRTTRMRWPAPAIDDLGALADFLSLDGDMMDWFADRREINRYARDERLRHYRYTWLPHRLIEAPKPMLRDLQRRLLAEVLAGMPVHERVHGFVPGRGVHTFAASHTGQEVLVSLDLRAFFSSITAARVYAVFRQAGYPEPVAHTLTALTTTRTPAHVLRDAPDATRAALLRRPHLPQGAPTSPALANLCAFRLDRRLTGLADRFGLHYSRYADDLAFSGTVGDRRVGDLISYVRAIVTEEGFRTHPGKTRVRRQGDRQLLAGLVVNARPAVAREDYDRLRAVLHNAGRHGLAAANREGHPDFAAHLAGRVAWMAHRHPTRAAKLHSLLRSAVAADRQ